MLQLTGAMAFQALAFQADGTAKTKDADATCNQSTLFQKAKVVIFYAAISFLMASLPTCLVESAWRREFIYIAPSEDPTHEERWRCRAAAVLRRMQRKDFVLRAVCCMYLGVCWFLLISFAANVDAGSSLTLCLSTTWLLFKQLFFLPLLVTFVLWL